MIDKPRIGYASLDQTAHVHAPQRYLPIIVLPGIAGSRLTDPVTGKLAWNPLGFPLGGSSGEFTTDFDRLSQVSAELVPDETHVFDEGTDEAKAAARIKHYYNVLHDVYGKFAVSLSTLDVQAKSLVVKPKVYCCGYDWRQDNAKSALRLAAVVEEALAETRERRVIIIAHSMGCLVARYYCRVLGGESKVHRLYLIGAPTLGAPNAFLNLKHGLPGFYAKDIVEDIQQGDKGAAVAEGIQMGSMIEGGILNAVNNPTQGAVGIATAFTGDLFIALSLGAGRLLSRDETMRFARQIPALYQLMPSALYCRDHKNWLIFDPAATGNPPTGFMITLPGLFDLVAEAAGDGFKAFFRPEDAERTSPLATRNMHTLVQRIEAIGKAPDVKQGILMTVELVERILEAFIDCTSNRQVYSDIYTGLLDVVELRAVCATNLALSLRFDDALIVDPRPEKGVSPLEFLAKKLLLPALSLNPTLAKLIHDKLPGGDAKDVKKKARAYMPPRTTNIYSKQLPVDAGAVLVPTDTLSNDDSNIVRWILIPFSLAMPAILAIAKGSSFAARESMEAYGDGTVPTASANPDAENLSNPFVSQFEVTSKANHKDLACDMDVYSWISEDIADLVPDFLAT